MSEEDGMKVAQYEADYSEMDGYEKEAMAGSMLNELGIPNEFHEQLMSQLDAKNYEYCLGNRDEPTNHLALYGLKKRLLITKKRLLSCHMTDIF